jgi:uncharacterized membrane protein
MAMRRYRLLNTLVLLALWAGSIWAYPRLPARIPLHFDLAGNPDGWSARSPGSWFLLPIVTTMTWAMMQLIASHAGGNPDLWNMPDKRRFLALDRARQAPIITRMQEFISIVGIVVTALMALVQAGVYQAATGRARGLPLFATGGIVAALLVLAVLAVRLNAEVRRMVREAEERSTAA